MVTRLKSNASGRKSVDDDIEPLSPAQIRELTCRLEDARDDTASNWTYGLSSIAEVLQ